MAVLSPPDLSTLVDTDPPISAPDPANLVDTEEPAQHLPREEISATPTFLGDIRAGRIRDAASITYETLRRPFSGLIGPTEKQRSEEMVPWGREPDGSVHYEYRPLGNRLEREQGLMTPFIPVPHLESKPGDSAITGIGKGAFNIGAGLVGGFESPMGAMLPGLGEVPAASRAIGGMFGAEMLSGVPAHLAQAFSGETAQQKTEGALGTVADLAFGGLGARHALRGTVPRGTSVEQSEGTPGGPPVESTPTFVQPARVLSRPPGEQEVQVPINVPAFDAAFAKDEGYYIPPGGGGAEILGRIQGFRDWRAQNPGAPIETPEAHVDENGVASIKDGRHRYADLRDSGQPIEVSMSPESLERAQKLGIVEAPETPATPSDSEGSTIYRAGNAGEKGVKAFSSWTEDRGTAEAYQDNPGFGGTELREVKYPLNNVLDANTTGRRGMSDLAEALGFSREEGETWFDNGWRYPWEESKKVREALKRSGYDAIRYPDDFPNGAITVVPLKDAKPKPAESQPPPPVPPKEAPPSAPTEDAGEETVSIKNAIMDRIMRESGLDPREHPEGGRRPWPMVVEEAKRILDRDPDAGAKLVDRLQADPSLVPSDTEGALLDYEVTRRMDARDAARQAEADASTPERRKSAAAKKAAALQAVEDVGAVAGRGGSASGRSLAFRKAEFNRDYTLAKMLASEAQARAGMPETEAERSARQAATEAKAEAIRKANEDAQAAVDREREGQTSDYVDQILKDVKIADVVKEKAAKGRPAKPNPLATAIHEGAAAARARIQARLRGAGGTTMTTGGLGGLGNLADYAIIGAEHILNGAKKIGEFTKKLKDEFGDKLAEHAPLIFDAAKRHLAATRRAAVQSLAKVIERAKTDAPEGLDHGTVGRVVRALATEGVGKQGGIEGVNELMAATHAEMEPLHPGVTERQVRDLFNNYGKATYPSKEAIAVQVYHARRVTLLQGQIADVQAKIDNLQSDVTLKRTGAQRPKPTLEERDLIKQKNDLIKQRDAAMRAAGIEVPEDANQLAGALTAAKTRARNELEALQKAIDTKTRIEKGRGSAPSDTELDGLRKQLAAKRKLYAEAFPETPETDAEKIDRALKALDRNIAEEDKMLREGRLTKPKGEAKPDSPELQRRAAELQAMRDFRHELADAAKTPEEREAGAIKDAIDAIERKKEALRTGDVGPKPAEQGPMSAHLEGLQWERDRLNKAIAAMRRAKAGGVPEERATESARKAALKAAEKRLVTVDAAIERGNRTGDYGQPAPKKPGVASGIAEVVAKRAEAKEKAETLAALRKFYKPPGPPKDLNATRNEQIRTASLRRQHELADRLASGHYTKPSVRKTILEAETERFKAAEKNLKRQWDTHLKQIEYDNRTQLQKAFDVASGVSRGGKLTRILTLGKLAVLSVHGLVSKPIYEAVGAVYSKLPLYSQIFRRATIEGGGSLGALADFYKGGAKGLHDAKQPLRQILSIVTRGGHGDIAARAEIRELYGKQGVEINPRWWDIPQLMHEAEKGPLKRAHFEYAKAKLTESLSKAGHDVSTEAMQKEINEQAYAYSKLSIMMGRTWFSDSLNRMVATLEQPSPVTGKVSMSKYAGAAALKSVLTFNTVATNHLITLLNHTPLGLLHGNIRAIKALATGIAELHPDDANSIARQLKQGLVGSAFMAIGTLLPQAFGGLDPRKKRDPGEPGFGEIQIGEHRIPKFVSLAVPPLLAAHIGATIMQEAHSLLRKKDKVEQGLGAGALAGFAAAVEGGPVVNESVRMQNLFEHGQRWKFISDWAASNGIPGIVDEAARWVDRWSQNHSLGEAFFGETPKRVPHTIIEGAEQHLPFFRGNVAPKATPKPKRLTHH